MVTQEQNNRLTSQPTMTELQEVVFSMDHNYAAEPNCIYGYLFKKIWHIINQDFMGVVLAFFQ